MAGNEALFLQNALRLGRRRQVAVDVVPPHRYTNVVAGERLGGIGLSCSNSGHTEDIMILQEAYRWQ
ncbi:hypothetical protein GCM10010913_35120 [Paenibacillus aceti]|uniref:Uncharacterized protein n=1 Tax=Paenibacillus aceti TaxID=1820010 RepID=A0ABQ1W3Z7_9BACL|nr:hypothetical protein GCM10010913_35120 [Paenibacillus aceti]